jgi:hypothetical protein
MKTIRASEIGAYIYCNRAWWYGRQGVQSENQEALVGGLRLHEQHGRSVLAAGCLRILAIILLLLAIVAVTVYLTGLMV